MKLIFHGHLRTLYGESATLVGNVPADAIEGFFSQQPNHPRDMLVEAVGFDSEALLHAETDAEEIHLIPAMFGGGGNFGKIILGAALIAIALINPGIGGMILSTVGQSVFLSMGVALAMQGVMGIFFKAPTTSKASDPSASKYLSITENTTAQGTPITVACGRVLIAGHWLSLQSDSNKLVFGNFPVSPT